MLEEKIKARLEELVKARQDLIDRVTKDIERFNIVIAELEALVKPEEEPQKGSD